MRGSHPLDLLHSHHILFIAACLASLSLRLKKMKNLTIYNSVALLSARDVAQWHSQVTFFLV